MSIPTTGMTSRLMLIKALAYVAPQIGAAILLVPVASVLAGIYAKYYGLALASIAAVMLVARLFDVVTDPVIAYYSDRWRARTGSRKLFILVGGLLLIPSSYFLCLPPENVDRYYFVLCYMAFYFSFTLFFIPYLAWANEFTESSDEKTLVFSLMNGFNQLGTAVFYLTPVLPFFVSSEITPDVLEVTVVIGSILFVVGLLSALCFVPDSVRPVNSSPRVSTFDQLDPAKQNVMSIARGFLANKPFLLYLGALMSLGFGAGMWAGLFFIYVDIYLKQGESFAQISLWGMVWSIVAIPIWYRLSLYWGKRNAWLVGMTLLLFAFVVTSFLRPGTLNLYPLYMLNTLMMFSLASMYVIAFPMLCDAIDYGRLNDGVERNALYFSIQAMLTKLQMAIGGAFGMAVVAWFGFDVEASQQSSTSILGLRLGVSLVPSVLVLMAMVFIAKMPLTEAKMKIIRRKLSRRDEQQKNMSTTEDSSLA